MLEVNCVAQKQYKTSEKKTEKKFENKMVNTEMLRQKTECAQCTFHNINAAVGVNFKVMVAIKLHPFAVEKVFILYFVRA